MTAKRMVLGDGNCCYSYNSRDVLEGRKVDTSGGRPLEDSGKVNT